METRDSIKQRQGAMEHEERLVDEARRGSKDAFADLVRLHQAQVRAYIACRVPDPDLRDDLAQEVFLSAYRSLVSFGRQSSFGTWLTAIAKNRVLHFLRSEQQRKAREGVSLESAVMAWSAAEGESPVVEAAGPERELSALKGCVGGLTEKSRRLIRFFYFEGRTAPEISRLVNMSEAAVWMALSRIRQALRRCVEARLGLEAKA